MGENGLLQRSKAPAMQSFPSNCWGTRSFGALKNERRQNTGWFHSETYGFLKLLWKKLNNLNLKIKKGIQVRIDNSGITQKILPVADGNLSCRHFTQTKSVLHPEICRVLIAYFHFAEWKHSGVVHSLLLNSSGKAVCDSDVITLL